MKKTSFPAPFLLFIFLPFLPHCGINLYVPNTLNTPLLHEKGDFEIAVGMVGSAPEPTFDLQGAYAPGDHVALLLNSSFMSNDRSDTYKNTHRVVEGGGGLFTTFMPHVRGWNIGRAEVMGGYGFGWAEDNDSDERFTGRYSRAFLQPAVGFRGQWFDIIFAGRLSVVNFSDYRREIKAGGIVEVDQFGFSAFEPTLTLSFGYQYVMFYAQMGSETILSGKENYKRVSSFEEDGVFNFGARFSPWVEEKHFEPPLAMPSGFSSLPDSTLLAMPALVWVPENQVTICFQSGEVPADGEVIDVVFNAGFLIQNLQMTREEQCLDLTVKKRGTGNLRFLLRDAGQHRGGTILLRIKSGGEEQLFYFEPEWGQKEEVLLRVRE